MDINFRNAFAEVLFIIKCLPYNDQKKISKKFIDFLDENKNNDYLIKINPNINLQNQELLAETRGLLKEIYLSYFASEEEKNKIMKFNNYFETVEKDLAEEKYNIKYN